MLFRISRSNRVCVGSSVRFITVNAFATVDPKSLSHSNSHEVLNFGELCCMFPMRC